MSEDNWSLKGKEWIEVEEYKKEHYFDFEDAEVVSVIVFPDGKFRDRFEGVYSEPEWTRFFDKNTIETLRQKLIEDVQGLCDDRIGKSVISIINRRFGVDVDACFSMNKNNSGGDR